MHLNYSDNRFNKNWVMYMYVMVMYIEYMYVLKTHGNIIFIQVISCNMFIEILSFILTVIGKHFLYIHVNVTKSISNYLFSIYLLYYCPSFSASRGIRNTHTQMIKINKRTCIYCLPYRIVYSDCHFTSLSNTFIIEHV